MKLNDYLQEVNKTSEILTLLENQSLIKKVFNTLKNVTCGKAKQLFKKSTKRMIDFFKKQDVEKDAINIINKYFGVNYKSLDQLQKSPVLIENKLINEDWCSWWKEASNNMYDALSFYSLLQAFLELDKLIKHSDDANISYVMVYFLIWSAIISGKIIINDTKRQTEIKN